MPDALAALTYDATMMLLQALDRTSKPGAESLKNSLSQLKHFRGVTGTISFDKNGDAVKSAVILGVGKDGPRYVTTVRSVSPARGPSTEAMSEVMELLGYILQQLVNGLQLGPVYALIALGYTMVYGVMQLINFADGDIFMFGGFVGYYLSPWQLPLRPVFWSPGRHGPARLVVERVSYRPLRGAPRISL